MCVYIKQREKKTNHTLDTFFGSHTQSAVCSLVSSPNFQEFAVLMMAMRILFHKIQKKNCTCTPLYCARSKRKYTLWGALCYQPHRSQQSIQDSYFEIIRDIFFFTYSVSRLDITRWIFFLFGLVWISVDYTFTQALRRAHTHATVTSQRIDDFGQQQPTFVRYKLRRENSETIWFSDGAFILKGNV